MRRLTSAVIAFALLAGIAVAIGFVVEKSAEADLDPKGCSTQSQVFTSRTDRVRIVIPRGWCATDHPSYPNLLVSMLHTEPPGEILLTSEPFTHELYCSWPAACRNQPTATAKYVCAIRDKLSHAGMRVVGPPQKGPKENEDVGLPSLWFEYDDGKRFLRQAVTVTSDRALSLVLTTPTNEARTTYGRLGGAFDQALRTLQVLTAAQMAPVGAIDAGLPADVVFDDAGQPITLPDGGAPPAPPPVATPIGPCPTTSR